MIITLSYYIIVALIVTTTVFGILFLTQFNESRESLYNFRLAKRMMAVAFFAMAAGNLAELLGHSNNQIETSPQDIIITQIVTLSISVSQVFILTLVCVMSLDPKSIKSKTLLYQTVAIITYILVAVGCYIFLPLSAVKISIYLLNAAYLGVLIYFTYYFVLRYRVFRQAMDNFYSDDIAARMRWIAVAFYCSLGIGVFSLITTQYFNLVLNIVFSISLLFFYSFFGIKLLNYPWQFKMIEKPMMDTPTSDVLDAELAVEQALEQSDDITEKIVNESTPCVNSDVCIGEWIAERHFLQSGITIDDLAKYLGTNRTYLSNYFNTEKGITFRQWINSLRIEEAKHIISDDPKITMMELASSLGYADTSTFFRQFKAIEGVQPSVWKQKICC